MPNIAQYSAVNGPFVAPDGRLSFAANVFLRELWLRGGGSIAPTNNELQASEYADAGIEESKAAIMSLLDQVGSLPQYVPAFERVDDSAEVASLRAEVDSLRSRIQALEEKP